MGKGFPDTRVSAIVLARSDDEAERARAYDVLVAAYWMPVYTVIRIKWGKDIEDAKDLTQGFFLDALTRNTLQTYEPGRGRFRTFLRGCLDNYLANQHKSAGRKKRGGDIAFLPLDFDAAEQHLAVLSPTTSPDDLFEAEWVRSLFTLAVQRLQTEMPESRFRLFSRYALEDPESQPTYGELAEEFGLTTIKVNNQLASARRTMKRVVLDLLRQLTDSEEDFRKEARALLGMEFD